jgi:hypothetical protein
MALGACIAALFRMLWKFAPELGRTANVRGKDGSG